MIEVGQVWTSKFNVYTINAVNEKYVIYRDAYGDERETTIQAFEDFIINRGGFQIEVG